MRVKVNIFGGRSKCLAVEVRDGTVFRSDPVLIGSSMVTVEIEVMPEEPKENTIESAKRETRISMLETLMGECYTDEIEEAVRFIAGESED